MKRFSNWTVVPRIHARAAVARLSICALLSAVLSVSTASRVWAVPVLHGDFLGVGAGDVDFLAVTEDSDTDTTPIYFAPTDLPNRLIFVPTGLAASSANGAPDTTRGMLSMNIRADAGFFLEKISISELGDYTLAGVGTPATFVDIVADLTVTDITPGVNGPLMTSLIYSPAPPFDLINSPGFQEFAGMAMIDLTGLGISEVTLLLEHMLNAESEMGTTSFIQDKTIDIRVTSVPVPEPAAAALAIMALLPTLARRRHRR